MSYKVFIDGQEGTTGLKIHKRLEERRDIEILLIDSNKRKALDARLEMMEKADISFLCLPDVASKEIVEKADSRWRILDTSTAHRTNSQWVYGFPELEVGQLDRIKKSNRVAVPGCYATGFISIVKPLISFGVIDEKNPLICHAITGYSGGGKKMIGQYENQERHFALDSPRQYGLSQHHKHIPEMMAISGLKTQPIFHPIVGDYFSGMMLTISLHKNWLKNPINGKEIRDKFNEYYMEKSMLRIAALEEDEEEGFLSSNAKTNTDGLEIFVKGNEEHISIIARYDNLGKGASGAAIQCMNIMLDIPEETGLVK